MAGNQNTLEDVGASGALKTGSLRDEPSDALVKANTAIADVLDRAGLLEGAIRRTLEKRGFRDFYNDTEFGGATAGQFINQRISEAQNGDRVAIDEIRDAEQAARMNMVDAHQGTNYAPGAALAEMAEESLFLWRRARTSRALIAQDSSTSRSGQYELPLMGLPKFWASMVAEDLQADAKGSMESVALKLDNEYKKDFFFASLDRNNALARLGRGNSKHVDPFAKIELRGAGAPLPYESERAANGEVRDKLVNWRATASERDAIKQAHAQFGRGASFAEFAGAVMMEGIAAKKSAAANLPKEQDMEKAIQAEIAKHGGANKSRGNTK